MIAGVVKCQLLRNSVRDTISDWDKCNYFAIVDVNLCKGHHEQMVLYPEGLKSEFYRYNILHINRSLLLRLLRHRISNDFQFCLTYINLCSFMSQFMKQMNTYMKLG